MPTVALAQQHFRFAQLADDLLGLENFPRHLPASLPESYLILNHLTLLFAGPVRWGQVTLWGLWHLHPQNWTALAPIATWYLFLTVALAIIMTWVWNRTCGNLLLVVLLHTASNVSDWLVPIVPAITAASNMRLFIIQLALMCIVAGIVAISWRSKVARFDPGE